eukprot:scaffold4607_cov39-Cyclotella_meneghiniana.AAC.10
MPRVWVFSWRTTYLPVNRRVIGHLIPDYLPDLSSTGRMIPEYLPVCSLKTRSDRVYSTIDYLPNLSGTRCGDTRVPTRARTWSAPYPGTYPMSQITLGYLWRWTDEPAHRGRSPTHHLNLCWEQGLLPEIYPTPDTWIDSLHSRFALSRWSHALTSHTHHPSSIAAITTATLSTKHNRNANTAITGSLRQQAVDCHIIAMNLGRQFL